MLDINIAKKLKDAGFSQERKLGGAVFYPSWNKFEIVCEGSGWECDCTTPEREGYGMGGESVYLPSLSQLISACGPEGFALEFVNDKKMWEACKWIETFGGKFQAKGFLDPVPENAVGILLLNLIEKGYGR